MDTCPLCHQDAEVDETDPSEGAGRIYAVECPRCGSYRIDRDFGNRLHEFNEGERPNARDRIKRWSEQSHLLSGYVRERNDSGDGPIDLTEDRIKAVLRIAPRRVDQRLNHLLLNLANQSGYFGDEVEIDPDTDYPLAYARNPEEFTKSLFSLKEVGLVAIPAMGSTSLTYHGWKQVETLHESGALSSQAFVAMQFCDHMHDIYEESLGPAISAAGYSPLNMAQLEHVDPIDARIMEEIDRSRFVVADVSGGNQGVYFEAGYALGQDIPVIWTCQQDNFPADAHFDTEHFNHIIWASPDELYEKLRTRIVAVIGEGSEASANDQ